MTKKTKRRYVSFLIVCCMIVCGGIAQAEIVDRIVAVVNDEPITQSEIDMSFAPIYQQYTHSYEGTTLMEKLEEARLGVLNQLIEDKLILQEAQSLEIEVSDDDVEARINELKQRFSSSQEFLEKMREEGLTIRSLRQRNRDQMMVQRLKQYQVYSRVSVSPQEVENYYNDHLDEYTQDEKVKASTIMVRKDADVEDQTAVSDAMTAILNTYKAGTSFADLAREHSQEAHAQDGGALGFVTKGDMIASVDEAIFATNVGELSEIIESDIGYHVFLIEAKQEKKVTDFEALKETIRNAVFRQKVEERYTAWIGELNKNAYISIK